MEKNPTLEDMPPELLSKVASFLTTGDGRNVVQACRLNHKLKKFNDEIFYLTSTYINYGL